MGYRNVDVFGANSSCFYERTLHPIEIAAIPGRPRLIQYNLHDVLTRRQAKLLRRYGGKRIVGSCIRNRDPAYHSGAVDRDAISSTRLDIRRPHVESVGSSRRHGDRVVVPVVGLVASQLIPAPGVRGGVDVDAIASSPAIRVTRVRAAGFRRIISYSLAAQIVVFGL